MTRQREYTVSPSDALRGCEEKAAAISWPVPIDRRLDELVTAVEQFGDRTTRKELAAAILLGSPMEPEDLSDLLRTYRRAVAQDAVLEKSSTDDNVLHLPRHRPGPRAVSP